MSKIDALIKDFNKQFKDDILAKGIKRVKTNKLPFSSPRANYMLYGGLPRGRIIEFAGEENGGKTTSALDVVANAQVLFYEEWETDVEYYQSLSKPTKTQSIKLAQMLEGGHKKVLYADCENTLDEDWAEQIGVDTAEMIVLKPQAESAEDIFEMTLAFIDSGEIGLVVIDSLGVLLSAQAYDKTMSEKTYGGIAMSLTLFSKKAQMLCQKHNTTLIGINQMRAKLDSPHGGVDTTGGKAWKHNCSVRLNFRKGDYIDIRGNALRRSAEEPRGNLVQISITKTKVCKPDRKAGYYTLMYDEGIDEIADTMDMGVKLGLIQKGGAWYSFIDSETGEVLLDEEEEVIKLNGKAAVVEYLKINSFIYDELRSKVQEVIGRIS